MKTGIFAIGLDTYWDQFEGLYDYLMGYHLRIKENLQGMGTEVFDAGMVDTPQKAIAAGESFAQNNVELVFIYISTYALSSTVLPVVQSLNSKVIILNIQPTASIDYEAFNALGDRGKMTGLWLENCQACSVPEVASVFNKARIEYQIISGFLDDGQVWSEIAGWVKAATIRHKMARNRVGILGHYYNGMLDVYTDVSKQSIVFKNHFEYLEMCEVEALRKQISPQEIEDKLVEFKTKFLVSDACEKEELIRSATTSVALDKLVEKHQLGSMAYYYE